MPYCISVSDCKAFTTNLGNCEELNMSRRRKRLIWIAPLALLAIALFAYIGGEIGMHLWNWLFPPLFGWRQIAILHAVGVLVLCLILFGVTCWHISGCSSLLCRIADRL